MITGDTAKQNPFPGLRPFREDEERFFFGRERQVDTMVNKLSATCFLAVVGTSGSGKSSLVNCGLRPALHRGLMASAGPAWRMAQFRPGVDPIHSLAEALAAEGVLYSGYKEDVPIEEIVETYLRGSRKGVVETFRKARLPEGTNLLIVADQFEELFRYQKLGTPDGKEQYSISETAIAFVNLLLEASAQHDYPIYVVITMRSDFLGDCSQFYGLPEAINEGQYLVPRMTRDERRASIAGPVSVGGAKINPGPADATGQRCGRQPRSAFHPPARFESHLGLLGISRRRRGAGSGTLYRNRHYGRGTQSPRGRGVRAAGNSRESKDLREAFQSAN